MQFYAGRTPRQANRTWTRHTSFPHVRRLHDEDAHNCCHIQTLGLVISPSRANTTVGYAPARALVQNGVVCTLNERQLTKNSKPMNATVDNYAFKHIVAKRDNLINLSAPRKFYMTGSWAITTEIKLTEPSAHYRQYEQHNNADREYHRGNTVWLILFLG